MYKYVEYIKQMFVEETHPSVEKLKHRIINFYNSIKDYCDFQNSNYKPEFWGPIENYAKKVISKKGKCKILEFGAGRTGFYNFVKNPNIKFHMQDITPQNKEYLRLVSHKVHTCEILEIKEKYDIIFSTFVWEHIYNPKTVLSHLLNLLNPGGALFIASPRYDFPFYLPPSVRHLSLPFKFIIGVWLFSRRIISIIQKKSLFIIYLDPAIFHTEWFRDADAIHLVSFWDIKNFLSSQDFTLRRIRISKRGLKNKIWEKYLLLFVKIQKQEPVQS